MEAGGQLEVDSDIMTLSALIKVATARKKKDTWWPKYVSAVLSDWNNTQTKDNTVTLAISCCNTTS